VKHIRDEIPDGSHIEIFLTHLGDLISLAERSRHDGVTLSGQKVSKADLVRVHLLILNTIADVIRWGYWPPDKEGKGERIGSKGSSIVEIKYHDNFVKSIFKSSRAGLDALRGPVHFFTTNYDTLIEDALALNGIRYSDGFFGGAVAHFSNKFSEEHSGTQAVVNKLHGSIDWFRSDKAPSSLLRVRFGDTYPGPGGQVMIYPQATKYMSSQLDPFLGLFTRFRERLKDGADHTLFINGYSFGDEHINEDIEVALSSEASQLTIIAFSSGFDGLLPDKLDQWRKSSWGNRVYIISAEGLLRGSQGPFFAKKDKRDWWTFEGASKLVAEGLPSDITEELD
jgi:hypothetical protein